MKPVAQVRILSALKVCRRNHVNAGDGGGNISKVTTRSMAPPPPPTTPTIPVPNLLGFGFGLQLPELNLNRPSPTFLSFFGNPCLDLFFRLVRPDTAAKEEANRRYLNELLPLAWSHNPLTTLKLICNLLYYPEDIGKSDSQGFYAAASWVQHNHPKTLASNLPAIAGEFHGYDKVLGILYRTLEGRDMGFMGRTACQRLLREGVDDTDDMVTMAKKALERYEGDPHYRYLHDRVSDLFADCLKSDIEKFKELQLKVNKKSQSQSQSDVNDIYSVDLTSAGKWCPYIDSLFDCTTLLSENVAKKIFPRVSYQGIEEDEAEHAERARELLMKEVLKPLEEPLERPGYRSDTNSWGYQYPGWSKEEPSEVHKYLEKVKAGGKPEIKADALLPHKIIEYVCDCDVLRQAAELQWKTMVEDVYLKQGKFKNCLAVCDVSGSMMRVPMDVSVALGILMSELSEEPWNGRVITFNRKPQLLSIQGDDLRSKCTFVRRMDGQDWHCEVDFRKMFDLILEVAVKGNVKPEKMIKRVFVFTIYYDFDEISGNRWESDYEIIQSEFKEKGYVVPHLVVWNLNQDKTKPAVPCTHPGVTMLSGFFVDSLVKSFLDNDGDIGPDHVMEAALSNQEYQNLVVVD